MPEITWGNDVVMFGSSFLRRVAFGNSLFNGYYVRVDLSDLSHVSSNMQKVQVWRNDRNLTKVEPPVTFGVFVHLIAGWVSSAVVLEDGRLYFTLRKLSKAGWDSALKSFNDWNIVSGKASLWYKDDKNFIYTCVE